MSEISYLLSEKDNIEKARDQIAAILAVEFANQYALATASGAADKEDYNARILLEVGDPLSLQTEGDSFPIVNVCLQGAASESGSTLANKFKRSAEVFIDCYASGNKSAGGEPNQAAALLAWKTARIARNIMETANYAYLNMRGVVSKTEITSMETGVPKSVLSASAACIVRIRLKVWLEETSPQTTGQTIEPYTLKILDENGQVVVDE